MLKVLSIGGGTALDAFSKGRAGQNDLQHVRIAKNHHMPLELNDYDLAQLDLAEVICIQGTWGSKHIKRIIRKENNTASSYQNNINQIIADYAEKNNKPLIVFETMTLSRMRQNYVNLHFNGITPKYYRMGLGHWMYGKAKWLTHRNDHLRIKLMHTNFLSNYNASLNFKSPFWQNNTNGYILLLPGLEHDPTNQDVEQWLIDSCKEIRTYTDRKIVIKKHPLSRLDLIPIANQFRNVELNKNYQDKLKDTTKNAYAAVIDCSTSIFELIDLGIPCFCGKDSFGIDLGNTDLSNIEKIHYANKEQYTDWVRRMSYTEFTIEELQSDSILDFFLELVEMH